MNLYLPLSNSLGYEIYEFKNTVHQIMLLVSQIKPAVYRWRSQIVENAEVLLDVPLIIQSVGIHIVYLLRMEEMNCIIGR